MAPLEKNTWRIYGAFAIAAVAVIAGLLLIERGVPTDARGMIGSVILAGGVILFFVTLGAVVGAYEDW